LPKQTFLNLPEEKRKRILDRALEEFASKPYSKASLSKIVSRAGIAKGSMYQYFEDKKDLFLYVFDLAGREKLEYIKGEIDPEADFFNLFHQTMLAGTRFNLAHPQLSKVLANVMEPSGEEVLHEVYAKGQRMSFEFIGQMIIRGQEQGTLRKDIDTRLLTYLVTSMFSLGLVEYILEDLNITMHELLKNPEAGRKITEEKVSRVVEQVVRFLRTGLAEQGAGNEVAVEY